MRADVEQIVHEPAQVARLALDHAARQLDGAAIVARDAPQAHGIGNGGERIAQLMPQHGEKFILAPVGVAQGFLRLVALRAPGCEWRWSSR